MGILTKQLQTQMTPLNVTRLSLRSSQQVLAFLRHNCRQDICPHHLQWQGCGSLAAYSTSNNGTGATIDPEGPQLQWGVANAVQTDAGRILDTELPDEVQNSYLSYAMSVIVGRALPDIRDGLKPVHRRILFAMHELGLLPSKPFRKSARVVGEVLGKYHPHGDTAVYEALVRLAQPFTMRTPLISGHGNFGSQDDDPPAAMRYTECRLQRVSSAAFLQDLEYDTVDFLDTFDGAQQEPTVLPARLPSLLINGATGIAVGMATRIPPHNMGEVVSGLEALIQDPEITNAELMKHIPGPDFPTGGQILAAEGLGAAYETGRGSIEMRGKAFIEDDDVSEAKKPTKRGQKTSALGKSVIVISELPYQVVKARLVAHIADLVNQGVLQGISDVRDESDREGMRIVVEVKKGFSAEVVLNGLHVHTQLQSRFPCNLVALVNGTPCTLLLKDFLSHFLDFRCDVVRRRANFMLRGAESRLHIVEGLAVAQQHMDQVVKTIRAAPDSASAGSQLQSDFGLSTEQGDAILSMTLRRLTALEIKKVKDEAKALREKIQQLNDLLGSSHAIRQTVASEAREIANTHGNPRRTTIVHSANGSLQAEDIIPNRVSIIVFSSKGYIKRMTPDHFSVQGRGGKGMRGAGVREDDSIEEVQQVTDHQCLLFFTSDGLAYGLKAYQIPEASRTASGISFSSLLKTKDKKVAAMIPVDDFTGGNNLLLLSKNGWMKQVELSAFSSALRRSGLLAMKMEEGDELTWVQRCRPGEDVILGHCDGSVARYNVDLFRPMSRGARGLQASRLREGNQVLGISTLQQGNTDAGDASDDSGGESSDEASGDEEEMPGSQEGPFILFVTDLGHGKLTPVSAFRTYLSRRKYGVTGIKLTEGARLASFLMVGDRSELDVLISTSKGIVTRISLQDIPLQGRSARGVILIRFKDDEDRVSGVTLLDAETAK